MAVYFLDFLVQMLEIQCIVRIVELSGKYTKEKIVLPEDIVCTILKYGNKNDIKQLNKSIDDIQLLLSNINYEILKKLKDVMSKSSIDTNKENELFTDSQTIRKYLSTMQLIDYEEDNPDINNSPQTASSNGTLKDIAGVDINFADVIVLSNINYCTYKGHSVDDVIAHIPTFTPDGKIKYIDMNLTYCNQCDKYIMLKSDFKSISGIIACEVIDETTSYNYNNSDSIEISQSESLLYKYGYNVKTKENISDKQRHLILAAVIESGILTRDQICSHLDTLIERGSKIDKWKLATQKWTQDRQYVKKYNSSHLPEILLNKVILKYHQKNV